LASVTPTRRHQSVDGIFSGAAGVKDLRIGEFIAYNRDSRAVRRGKLF
jgi:hypothetical protein